MSTHTPGPWEMGKGYGLHGIEVVGDQGDRMVAGVVGVTRDTHALDGRRTGFAVVEEGVANARLIAAAPDLLALAEQYASECAECDGKGIPEFGESAGKPCTQCADIRSVIAKATGEGT